MGRKLKGRGTNAKGLKGALLRHELKEKTNLQRAKSLAGQKEVQDFKLKSIKGGGKQKRKPQLQPQPKGLNPFTSESSVLLIGEGDFSFAKALVEENYVRAENVIATSFDTRDEVVAKYPNMEEILGFLAEEGVKVLHSVDAANLVTSLRLKAGKKQVRLFDNYRRLDYIMFNFPHTGRGMKDVDRNIRDHQKLVLEYFRGCKEVFSIVNNMAKNDFGGYSDDPAQGRVILSLFEGEPYNSWGVKILGRSTGLRVERSGRFEWLMFPSYHHRRTNSTRDTTKPAEERAARIYVFSELGQQKAAKEKNDSDEE